ncbi:uncharacterized protein zgc:193711 [Colossoma macropomum]|uniref:uncharacterized protein zgc:193711 n=1 Tax=Colossoma macropomum TaxID=42526 RepID=UPI0018652ACD|nr:uncharacterized protein zgc:193711 [Colossoma macropomum]
MGNGVTKALAKWGINPRKLSLKRSSKRAPRAPAPSHQPADAHIYDQVAAEPEYAQVNKKKKTDADDLHYADVQVLQSEDTTGRERQRAAPVNNSSTEYATIDFLKSGFKTHSSPEPADILIPPGELRRPVAKPRSVHKKSTSSHRSVMV